MNDELSWCAECQIMTISIRKARALFICSKCGNDKTLSDVFQSELTFP